MGMLGGKPPRFAHVPLVVHADGSRLAKRARGVAVRHHREDGRDPRWLVAARARALGLAQASESLRAPQDLVAGFSWDRVARGPVVIEL
jgi:glutamyl-tRNA synthetase